MDDLRDGVPLITEEIAQKNEAEDPDCASRPGVGGEGGKLKPGDSRDDGGKVPQAGDEVSNRERPVSDAVKPSVHLSEAIFRQVEAFPIARHRGGSQGPPDRVTQADAAPASGH